MKIYYRGTGRVALGQFTYLCGETSITGDCTGCSWNAHPASYNAADRTDEAGLSSTDWPVEHDPEMFDLRVFRFIILHILQVFLFVAV